MSSIFSKIISKDIASYIVYEDEIVLAFLDISQATPGHTLIVPKKAFKDIFELPDDIASHIFSVAQKVSTAIKKAFNPAGLNILSNNGEIAGQTIFHFHLHLIPRYQTDDIVFHFKNHAETLDAETYQKRAALITSALL